jgi:hypothetical protein
LSPKMPGVPSVASSWLTGSSIVSSHNVFLAFAYLILRCAWLQPTSDHDSGDWKRPASDAGKISFQTGQLDSLTSATLLEYTAAAAWMEIALTLQQDTQVYWLLLLRSTSSLFITVDRSIAFDRSHRPSLYDLNYARA